MRQAHAAPSLAWQKAPPRPQVWWRGPRTRFSSRTDPCARSIANSQLEFSAREKEDLLTPLHICINSMKQLPEKLGKNRIAKFFFISAVLKQLNQNMMSSCETRVEEKLQNVSGLANI